MANPKPLSAWIEDAPPWLLYLAVALVWLGLSSPWLLGQVTIPWDSKVQFYPWMVFVQQNLHQGELPLWNPHLYSGYPMVADPQAMLFSPLLQAGLFLLPELTLRLQDSLVLLHLLLAGLGAAALGRSYGWPVVAVLIFAALVMFGGVNSSRLQHNGIVIAYGYFPFALYFLKRMLDTRRVSHAGFFGLFAGAMALHMTQVPYLLTLLLMAYAAFRLARDFTGIRSAFPTVGQLALSGAVAAAVMLPQAIPTIMTLGLSNREAMPLELASGDSIPPHLLATLAMPEVFGHVRGGIEAYWSAPSIPQTYFYIGLLPLLAALAFPVPKDRPRDWGFYCGLFLVSGAFMMGTYTPFYAVLYEYLPGLASFRRPADGAYLLNFALAFLAASAITEFLRHGFSRLTFHPVAHPLIALSAVAITWSLVEQAAEHEQLARLSNHALVFAGLSAALVLAATTLRRWPPLLALATGLLAFADLRLHAVDTAMNGHAPDYYEIIHAVSEEAHPVAAFLARETEAGADGLPPRIEFHRPGSLWDNSVAINGFFSTTGNSPFGLARYENVAGFHYGSDYPRSKPPSNEDYSSNVFHLLGARYLVSAGPLGDRRPANGAVLEEVFEAGGIRVWENPNALPRAFMPRKWELDLEPKRTIARGSAAGMNFRETVVLEERPEWPGENVDVAPGEELARGDVEVVAFRNNEIVMRVESSGDGLVFLSEVYHPAWTAKVNGESVPLYRANYVFRAVPVPEGRHTVTLSFRPYRALRPW